MFDAQISGGLLISVPEKSAPIILNELEGVEYQRAVVIGSVEEGAPCVEILP